MSTTSSVLDKATAHFRNKIAGEMSSFKVEEWDTTIYFKQANSLKEEAKILELSQQGKTVEALIETIIIRARNEDGTKMFKPMDRTVFMNEVDPAVIISIAGKINKVDEDLEAVEKN